VAHRPAPPYAIPAPTFRFPRLAALAAAAPLGGTREVLLAAFVTARLAASATGSHRLPPAARQARAQAAQSWVATLSLTPAARAAASKAVAATAEEDPAALREAIDELVGQLGLEGSAARELSGCAPRGG
jgi:hypothetical protein